MASPFPGMDPYLEDPRLWPDFQHQLVACLFQLLLPNVTDRYRARVVHRSYATETPLFTSVLREEHTVGVPHQGPDLERERGAVTVGKSEHHTGTGGLGRPTRRRL